MRQECECQQCECQQCDATSVRKKCDSSANANSANRIFSFLLIEKFNNRVLRLPKKKYSLIKNITWECKHCGASLGRHDPFSSMETKSCLFEEMSPISGYFPSNARWRSEGKGRSREDKMAMLPRVLTCPFRRRGFDSSHWLFSQCFRAPSPNTVERSQSINGHQNWKLKRNFGRQSSISCVSKMGKEGQNACRKIEIELSQLRARFCTVRRIVFRTAVAFALLAFAPLSHSHCWHSHCWPFRTVGIRTVGFALVSFALLSFALLSGYLN